MKTTINVVISNVKTDKESFSFKFKVFVNGRLKSEGKYEGDHAWGEYHKNFEKELINGYAAKYAIELSF